jgi:hypothetical protein
MDAMVADLIIFQNSLLLADILIRSSDFSEMACRLQINWQASHLPIFMMSIASNHFIL